MCLLYSSTSSSVCIEVSVGACLTWGAAADNYPLKNGMILSSTAWPHRRIRVCLTSRKLICVLSVAELVAVSIVALCDDLHGWNFSCLPSVGLILGQCCPFSPWKMMWSAGTKGILFSQALQHCLRRQHLWESRGTRGWEGQRKGKKSASPCVFVMFKCSKTHINSHCQIWHHRLDILRLFSLQKFS